MRRQLSLLLGISIFWLALSMLFDGVNTLVLPRQLLGIVEQGRQATVLGLVTFLGLFLAMLIQPVAGDFSDRLRARWGRRRFIGLGTLLILISLAIFGLLSNLAGVIAGYLALQLSASVAQAGQQGFIPDLVPARQRGVAAGLKGFMDIGGAMLGFVVLGELLGQGRTGMALAVIAMALAVAYLLTLALVREARDPSPASQQEEVIRIPALRNAFRLDLGRHRAFAWLVLSRFLFLLGTYAIGRFLLLFVAERLGLQANQAAEQAGGLLAALALVTVLAALPAGWAADRLGRKPLMLAGALFSGFGALLLITASNSGEILVFGALMALGSAAFTGANWAMTADLAPPAEAARFFGLANFGTAGAAAAAGLFGPLVDWTNRLSAGAGFPALFIAAATVFAASALVLRGVVEAQPRPRALEDPVRPTGPSQKGTRSGWSE